MHLTRIFNIIFISASFYIKKTDLDNAKTYIYIQKIMILNNYKKIPQAVN